MIIPIKFKYSPSMRGHKQHNQLADCVSIPASHGFFCLPPRRGETSDHPSQQTQTHDAAPGSITVYRFDEAAFELRLLDCELETLLRRGLIKHSEVWGHGPDRIRILPEWIEEYKAARAAERRG